MYKIVGADGREYSVFNAEQLQQWIAEGRANARTMTRQEGSAEWKPLAEFPEFAAALGLGGPGAEPGAGAGDGGAAGASPAPVKPVDPYAFADAILARDYDPDIGGWFSRGWELLKSDFWLLFGCTMIAILLMIAAGMVPFGGVVVQGPLYGGLYWIFLRRLRGQPAGVEDIFHGFKTAFVQLFLASLVSGLLTSIGALFCLIPGIYLAVCWQFPLLLVIDREIGFWEAMEVSRRVVTRHWFWMFLFILAQIGIGFLGLLACGVGLLLAMPVAFAVTSVAYEEIYRDRPGAAGMRLSV